MWISSANQVQFTVASESTYAAERKKLILATKDGGVNTLKFYPPPPPLMHLSRRP